VSDREVLVLAAVIGASGVILGGLITSGGTFLAERARARREDERETERAGRELTLVARLVMEELAEIRGAIEQAVASGRYWTAAGRRLPTTTWNEYREALARLLVSPDDWRYVANTYLSANEANWLAQEQVESGEPKPPIELVELRRLFRGCDVAMGALQRHVGPVGIFGRTGYADPEDIERRIWSDRVLPEDPDLSAG
jgi:hypothetical protein